MSSEQVAAGGAPRHPRRAESADEAAGAPSQAAQPGHRRRCRHRRRHPGAPVRAAVPAWRPARRRVRLPGLLHQRHARVPAAPRRPRPRPGQPDGDRPAVVTFHPSITSTIVTMWIVMAVLIVLPSWRPAACGCVPRTLQNLCRVRLRVARELRGRARRGRGRKPYIPLFAAFFVLILFCNWSGLIPPIGKVEELRAPTSDLNITIGLALVAFVFFEFQGFKQPRLGGYLRKFFPFYEFKQGHRRRDHRPVRRPHRAHARVRQAGDPVDAALRQHLRRRGRPGRRSAR